MQIHNNTLIAECSSYDFKEMLERKKVKSWLKSVSAFVNTDGGSLFYGVNDDGVIVGLENPQADADFISETIKARLDPVPEIANRVNSTLKKYPVNEESLVEMFGVNADQFEDTSETPKKVSKIAQKIIDLVIPAPSITADNMANKGV